jgi:hypothetical protein
MNKAIMMTGVAGYLLGFGVYVIVYSATYWGDGVDYFTAKFVEGVGSGMVWPYLLFRYMVDGIPMM